MKNNLTRVLVLLCLILAGMPTQLYAADGLTFSVGSISDAAGGETITAPLMVSNNPGFTAVGLLVMYDPSVLEITNVDAPVSSMPLNSQFTLTSIPGMQWIHLVNTDLVDWNGNGTIVNLRFNVNPTAAAGASAITLAFTNAPDGTPTNASGSILADALVFSGSIQIANTVDNTGFVDAGDPSDDTHNHLSGSDDASENTPDTIEEDTEDSNEAASYTTNRTENDVETTVNNPTLNNDGILTDVDNGDFIGKLYPSTNDGVTTALSEPNESEKPPVSVAFGRVPQTGSPDIFIIAAALCVSFTISMALWVYLLTRRRIKGSNGKA